MKTYNTIDPRTGNKVTLIRLSSPCACLGCFFLDEETGGCLAPMPIELGADCIEIFETDKTQHYQFKEL